VVIVVDVTSDMNCWGLYLLSSSNIRPSSNWTVAVEVKQSKQSVAVCKHALLLWELTCHMGSHTVLPATQRRWQSYRFKLVPKLVTPRDARLSWPSNLGPSSVCSAFLIPHCGLTCYRRAAPWVRHYGSDSHHTFRCSTAIDCSFGRSSFLHCVLFTQTSACAAVALFLCHDCPTHSYISIYRMVRF